MSAAANARWIGVIQLSKIGVQLLSIAVLSRLLAPQDFGLVALASAVSTFALLFRDLGIAPAIIQSPQLDEATKSAAFWLSAAVGLLLCLLLVVAAPLIAALMNAPDLVGILALLALTFPVAGATVVHQALLERASRFALVARIEISSLVAGFSVAVLAAILGAGAYSLVLQAFAIALFTSLQLWVSAHWTPSQGWSLARIQGIWAFSRNMLAFNIVNYFGRNADALIIGKFLGPAALGVYSVAYRTMLFPLNHLTFVANRALFPVMSRRQTELGAVAAMYLRSVSVIAFFTAPLTAGLFVLREPFVLTVFGAKWHAAADLIAWLAPIGFVQSIVSASGPVFMALGRTATLLRVTVAATILHVIGFCIGVRWNINGVAMSYFTTNLIVAIPILVIVMRCLDARVGALFAAVRRPILFSLVMASAVHAARAEFASFAFPAAVELAALVAIGAGLYLALAQFAAGALTRDVFNALTRRA
jgi:O-antigen/teichoic acid export membrane protein